jgi:hypothetical protein
VGMVMQLNAQMKLSYSIGSIGGAMKTSTYSSPIVISGENCIKVTNSISKFAESKKGLFYSTCAVNINFEKIQLNLSPNPVINYTVLKFSNQSTIENRFRVLVYNNSGQVVQATETTKEQLVSGYKLNLTSLVTGSYFVQVSSGKVLETLKFLKN